MRLPIRALAAALAAGLFGVPALTLPGATTAVAASASIVGTAAAQAPLTAPTVEIVPSASGVVRGGDEVTFSIRVSNATADPLEQGSVEVLVERAPVADRSALSLWLDGSDDAAALRASPAVTVDAPALLAGESTTLDAVVVSAAALGFTASSPFGAHRVAAEYATGDLEVEGHTAIVTATGTLPSVGLAVALPLVLPASSDGLIPADQLGEYTSVGGLLDRQLDAAAGRDAAVGVDPRIIASIRALGPTAPPSAIGWLTRLQSIPNQTFPLAYADADIAGISQSGGSMLAPTAFDVDESLFPAASDGEEPPGSVPAASAPAAGDAGTGADDGQGATEGEDATSGIPTADELLARDYTTTGVAWPRESTVVAADLDAFAASGLTTTILSSGDTSVAGLPTTPSASATVGDDAVLVSDSELSALLSAAAIAETDADWQAATGELTAALAVLAGERANRRPIEGRAVLATLARDQALHGGRLGATLDAVAQLDWVTGASLTGAMATAPVEATLVDHPEPAERVAQLRRLTDAETAFSAFANVVADPETLTRERRPMLLALASHAWTTDSADLTPAVDAFVAQSDAVIGSVQVSDSSTVNFLQDDGDLPVTVSNGLDQPVTVHLRVRPATGILDVLDDSVELEIEAHAQERAAIPVQAVANGVVSVEISLTTSGGAAVGAPKTVQVNVQAGWETALTAILAGLVVLVFAIGILRTIRRRRRRRRGERSPAEDPA